MLKRQSLLFCIIVCIISAGSLFGAGTVVVMAGAPAPDLKSANSVQAQPVHTLTVSGDLGSPSYLFQLASGSTNASPGKASPYPNCPGGVSPDIPKPHDGGGGKKKMPGPVVVPCGPVVAGGTAKHG